MRRARLVMKTSEDGTISTRVLTPELVEQGKDILASEPLTLEEREALLDLAENLLTWAETTMIVDGPGLRRSGARGRAYIARMLKADERDVACAHALIERAMAGMPS